MLLFRNAVSREVVVGAENRVEQCTYAAVITRVAEEMPDEITGGWKVIEVMCSPCQRSSTDAHESNVIDGAQICKSISITFVDGNRRERSAHTSYSIHSHTLFVAYSSTHHSSSPRHILLP